MIKQAHFEKTLFILFFIAAIVRLIGALLSFHIPNLSLIVVVLPLILSLYFIVKHFKTIYAIILALAACGFLGILFKFNHWPGGAFLMIPAMASGLLFAAVLIRNSWPIKDFKETKQVLSLAIGLLLLAQVVLSQSPWVQPVNYLLLAILGSAVLSNHRFNPAAIDVKIVFIMGLMLYLIGDVIETNNEQLWLEKFLQKSP